MSSKCTKCKWLHHHDGCHCCSCRDDEIAELEAELAKPRTYHYCDAGVIRPYARVLCSNCRGVVEDDKRDFDPAVVIKQQQSELAAYRWIPVLERLPEEKEEVLMATSYGLVTTVKYQDDSYVRLLGCRRCAGMSLGSVTHWMPIPPLPGDKP